MWSGKGSGGKHGFPLCDQPNGSSYESGQVSLCSCPVLVSYSVPSIQRTHFKKYNTQLSVAGVHQIYKDSIGVARGTFSNWVSEGTNFVNAASAGEYLSNS